MRTSKYPCISLPAAISYNHKPQRVKPNMIMVRRKPGELPCLLPQASRERGQGLPAGSCLEARGGHPAWPPLFSGPRPDSSPWGRLWEALLPVPRAHGVGPHEVGRDRSLFEDPHGERSAPIPWVQAPIN